MYKHLYLFAMLLLGAVTVSAQQEVYFNDTNIDRKDIQVERMVQGVSLNINLLPIIEQYYILDAYYFRDDRIAPTLVFHSFAGMQNMFTKNYSQTTNNIAFYDLNVTFGTEFRWYFSHRARYMGNRKITNNTGWFAGIPVKYAIVALNQPRDRIRQWLPESFSSNLSIEAKIGFRYAFSSCWLLETVASYTPIWLIINRYGCSFYPASYLTDMFSFELKAAYVFD